MAFDEFSGEIFVAGPASGNVTLVDAADYTVLGRFQVGSGPVGITFEGSNRFLYVANQNSGTLSIVSDGLLRYAVTFQESGLPNGTFWSVNLGAGLVYADGARIVFHQPNGTYAYTLGTVPGWEPTIPTSELRVRGSAVTLDIPWARTEFSVSFTETGLSPGTSWSVTLANVTLTSNLSLIAFGAEDGSYTYTIGPVPGWTTSTYSGSISVNGTNRSVPVDWMRTYAVSVSETGLPEGEGWWMDVPALYPSLLTPTPTLTLTLPNGTYPYTAETVDTNYSTVAGAFTVSGQPISVQVRFSRATYLVTFAESGLPSGTYWEVTLNGTSMTGPNSLSFGGLPNGTYGFTAEALGNPGSGRYVPTPASGSINIAGEPVRQTIEFTETPVTRGIGPGPSPFLGLPATEGYDLLGGIATAVVVVALVALMWSHRSGSSRNPAISSAQSSADRTLNPNGHREGSTTISQGAESTRALDEEEPR
jgi:hypothetical protein